MKMVELTDSGRNILKNKFSFNINIREDDKFSLFSLSLFVGFYVLFHLIVFFLPDGISEQEETYIFVLGWILAPIFSVLSVLFFVWIANYFLDQVSGVLKILLSVNSILFAVLITAINLTWQVGKSGPVATNLMYISDFIIPAANLVIIIALKYIRINSPLIYSQVPVVLGGIGLVNFIGLFPYENSEYVIPVFAVVLSLIVAIFIASFVGRVENKHWQNRKWIYFVDGLMVFLIFVTCFNPTFSFDSHHYNFYMGPMNRILHGGTMMVDTFSQYGNLIIYFLSQIFVTGILPLSYESLSFVISILVVLQFILVYVFLAKLVKDRFLVLALMVVAISLNIMAAMGDVGSYPSTGPLRFGLINLILVLILLRNRFPSFYWFAIFLEYGLVGISFLWSFETFVYTGFSYLGICLIESINGPYSLPQAARRFLFRFLGFLFSLAAAFGIFNLATYARAHVWPDWMIYLEFIKTYSSLGGFGDLPIDTWAPWIFPIIIYFASLMIFLFRYFYLKIRKFSIEEILIWGLTFFGIAQYTYFLGRSHPNNLFHITIPVVIVFGYWMNILMHKETIPQLIRWSSKVVVCFTIALVVIATWSGFYSKYQNSRTLLTILGNNNFATITGDNIHQWFFIEGEVLKAGTQDQQVAEAKVLIQKYVPEGQNLSIFLLDQNTTEVLMYNHRIQSLPISDIIEDGISPMNVTRVLNYPDAFKPGDFVFLEIDSNNYADRSSYNLVLQVIDKLCKSYTFEKVETSPGGVFVVRLKPFDNTPSPYCENIANLLK